LLLVGQLSLQQDFFEKLFWRNVMKNGIINDQARLQGFLDELRRRVAELAHRVSSAKSSLQEAKNETILQMDEMVVRACKLTSEADEKLLKAIVSARAEQQKSHHDCIEAIEGVFAKHREAMIFCNDAQLRKERAAIIAVSGVLVGIVLTSMAAVVFVFRYFS
jgi:hypothetical protein